MRSAMIISPMCLTFRGSNIPRIASPIALNTKTANMIQSAGWRNISRRRPSWLISRAPIPTGQRNLSFLRCLFDELIFGEIRRRHNAPVDYQQVTIDKIRIVADQEERRLRLILRGSQSPREVLKRAAASYIVIEPNRGARAIRHDAIDPYFMRCQLHRHRARHVDHAGFGRGISDTIRPSNQTGRGPKIDDLSTPTLLRHLRCDVLRHEIRSLKADSDDFVEFLFRAFENIRVIG